MPANESAWRRNGKKPLGGAGYRHGRFHFRPPDAEELAASQDYLSALDRESAWRAFAQSLFNLKEFIYVR